ncbi:MAG TPA: hypothetical protein VNG33_18220, partial [Polyangiaceae bacterium]|nr:hypothetical protein [Polyangiaceae bacterium]
QAASSGQSVVPPALDPFAPETALPSDADVWNVNLSDTDSRTMTTAEVIEGFRAGVVTTDAFVWKDGMGDWVAIMSCVELAPLLAGPTDPPAPVAGQTPLAPEVAPAPAAAATPKVGGMPMLGGAATGAGAARAASAKAQPGADLFGNLDAAGSEGEDIEINTSASRAVPVAPGATAYDDKPTGARNENSVLFSLDSLKAGFTGGAAAPAADKGSRPSAPKPGAPRPQQVSNPDDVFGMGSSGVAGVGGGSPLFSMNANQALLTAPAPPEPKPLPMAAYVPGSIPPPAGMDDKTKKLVMYGGAGAFAVIAILLGVILFGGKDKKDEAAADAAKSALSAQANAPKPEEKKEEPKPEEKKAEEPTPTPAPSASAEEKKPDAAKATAAGHTTTAAATTAKKPEEPAPAGPSTAPPFSKASAISALGGAAGSAGGCKKPGGPTGVGKVQVTFAPSGKVTSATVMGPPFAGTAVGGCVAGAFRRAHVPAFSGNAVTVSKSFAIN